MLDFINDVAQYEFLQRALITAILVGVVCGIVGTFIVLRGLALMGDAIAHAVLPGVAVSYLLGVSTFFGALLFGIIASLSIGAISQNSRIKSDSSIGIVLSAFLALGVILIAQAQTAVDLSQILFGNVLAVAESDMMLTVVVTVIVVALLLLFYKELLVSTFDPTMAQTYGLNVRTIHYALMVVLTVVTVTALQAVGVILVVALLITPAATAHLLTNRLSVMILLASTIGALSAISGIYFSFEYNASSGAVIVLSAAAAFLIAFFFAPQRGLIAQRVTRRRTVAAQSEQRLTTDER